MGFLMRLFLFMGTMAVWGHTFTWPFFMAYTETDLNNIRTAMVTIATRGSAEVEINGRRIRYLDITKLQTLLDTIEAAVNANNYGAMIDITFKEVAD